MHTKFGFHEKPFDLKALNHRVEFLDEEMNEIKLAIKERNAHDVLDGLIDLIVVAAGTIDLAQADGEDAWREVMTANNAKEVGFNEKRPNSEGVDLIKPEGWTPPDVSPYIGRLHSILTSPEAHIEDLAEGLNNANPFHEPVDQIGMDMARKGAETTNLGFEVPGYFHKEGDIVMINGVLYEPKANQEFGKDRAAVRILQECINLMRRKAQDYTSQVSSVKPADYYPNGIDDFVYMIDVLKRFRMISVLENMKQGGAPNFDSLEDILKDRIVYLALALEWVLHEMSGQNHNHDIWNRPQADYIITGEN